MTTKVTLADLHTVASARGGLLISSEWSGNLRVLLEWKCEFNHIWKAHAHNIVTNNSWCPKCANNVKHTLSMIQDYANNKNGRLLSTTYVNSKEKLLWECENKHTWEACWNSVNHNSWCPACYFNRNNNINRLQDAASAKGGRLISLSYNKLTDKLLWECENKHTWKTSADSIIRRNSWCPKCSRYTNERNCIATAETILGISLTKTRIYGISENKHKFIEFDGYNKEKSLAIEYHGKQHFEQVKYYQPTEAHFLKQQQNDAFKREYCKQNNIILIEIPYTEIDTLSSFLTTQFIRNNIR
jgi:hypothetical protein